MWKYDIHTYTLQKKKRKNLFENILFIKYNMNLILATTEFDIQNISLFNAFVNKVQPKKKKFSFKNCSKWYIH